LNAADAPPTPPAVDLRYRSRHSLRYSYTVPVRLFPVGCPHTLHPRYYRLHCTVGHLPLRRLALGLHLVTHIYRVRDYGALVRRWTPPTPYAELPPAAVGSGYWTTLRFAPGYGRHRRHTMQDPPRTPLRSGGLLLPAAPPGRSPPARLVSNWNRSAADGLLPAATATLDNSARSRSCRRCVTPEGSITFTTLNCGYTLPELPPPRIYDCRLPDGEPDAHVRCVYAWRFYPVTEPVVDSPPHTTAFTPNHPIATRAVPARTRCCVPAEGRPAGLPHCGCLACPATALPNYHAFYCPRWTLLCQPLTGTHPGPHVPLFDYATCHAALTLRTPT